MVISKECLRPKSLEQQRHERGEWGVRRHITWITAYMEALIYRAKDPITLSKLMTSSSNHRRGSPLL